MQVECADAVLQGPGHRQRTLGPAVYSQVPEERGQGVHGRASRHKEAEEALDAQG